MVQLPHGHQAMSLSPDIADWMPRPLSKTIIASHLIFWEPGPDTEKYGGFRNESQTETLEHTEYIMRVMQGIPTQLALSISEIVPVS